VPIAHAESSVACASPSACFAVGVYSRFAEKWNGRTWSAISLPGAGKGLNDISCGSSRSCVAVGSIGNTPLVERWNGRKWRRGASLKPAADATDRLVSISCVSQTFCLADGQQGMSSATGYVTTFFSETWDGRDWAKVAMPSASGGVGTVHCVSPVDCWAEGGDLPSSPPVPPLVADHWDGQTCR